jgi:peroxiredoxin Q/BCP
MAQLRQDYEQFNRRDAEIVVIGPEGPEEFTKFWNDKDMPFVGLPDPEQRVLRQFGQEIKLLKAGRMPAQLIIDKAGVARYVHYSDSMNDIPQNQELLALIDDLKKE